MSDSENSDITVRRQTSKMTQHSATLGFIDKYSFKPEDWGPWLKKFNRYRNATNLDQIDGEKQVNFLIISMGDNAENVLIAAGVTEEDEKTYDKVVEKLNKYFTPRVNLTYERAKFNQRVQKQNEPISDFITDVHKLASSCDYKDMKDSLIRDKLIVGITDSKLSKELQLMADLTLHETINRLKQSEIIKNQQITVNRSREQDFAEIDQVKKHPNLKQNIRQYTSNCFYCGGQRHPKEECPAQNIECYYCGLQGHFSRCCKKRQNNKYRNQNNKYRNPTLNQIQENTENRLEQDNRSEDGYYINRAEVKKIRATTRNYNKQNEFEIDVKLDGKLEHFKIDSGADVTIVPPRMARNKLLTKSNIVLKTPGGKYLTVLGKFEGVIQYKNKTTRQTIYVIDGQEEALIGKPCISALGFLRVIRGVKNDIQSSEYCSNQNINTDLQKIKNKYPSLFNGIGKMKKGAQLKLKQNAVPMELKTPRNIPIPLREKVKNELKRMVEAGIIEEVCGPTEWCHPMVVRPKPNGSKNGNYSNQNTTSQWKLVHHTIISAMVKLKVV
ncbi:uncharacterized protein LOC128989388 [Macrosteles quadrilineatus]|uniref:uncharacterized protein LOC128989388 n=1 Tax=Macrosteles quadrilineatus TaxID=74068 RepID=UPI0023E0E5C7|nr:uncharacterized protein LOC128989388 [Macrosteles quadrilineatus]